ncbi:MAG: cytochrome C [Bacteroidetes bacterium]|nr:MAG: cytochrome C [Bacteroidota bacterium]REK07543.1 MAG: cytochrome C [Bacteroidota bacterium]REK37024.1 MAG: cytochrome C [Bacteroidota bacterium]REK47846.1 MAG: cytochrome C [Bacteroidota bacterium]
MIKKLLISLLVIIVVVIGSMATYVQMSWDKKYDWPAPSLAVSTDSAVIAKGKYLVNGPSHCVSCHVGSIPELVEVDQGKVLPLKGGLGLPLGPLGVIRSRNLTPDKETGIGRYTDAELFRMMRHGIRPDGVASMPVLMPFFNMADEDLVAIVSYLRSLEPVKNNVPENDWTFMGKVVRTFSTTFRPIEKPTPPPSAPAMAPTIERGEYLAKYLANCVGCHTQRDMMTYEAIGPEFAGGMEFEPWPELHNYLKADPELWLRTPNITFDPGGSMAKFKTPQDFIDRFRMGRTISFSPMDWGSFSRMSDEDLTAIYMFLQSLPPVKKDIGEIAFKPKKD